MKCTPIFQCVLRALLRLTAIALLLQAHSEESRAIASRRDDRSCMETCVCEMATCCGRAHQSLSLFRCSLTPRVSRAMSRCQASPPWTGADIRYRLNNQQYVYGTCCTSTSPKMPDALCKVSAPLPSCRDCVQSLVMLRRWHSCCASSSP